MRHRIKSEKTERSGRKMLSAYIGSRLKTRHKILAGIFFFAILINALAWYFPGAVDAYRIYLFPIGTNTLARFMSLFPFSVGEILIILGILVLAAAVAVGVAAILKKGRFRRFAGAYLEFIIWILAWAAVTETFGCFVNYHATPLEEAYFSGEEMDGEILVSLYEYLVEEANELSLSFEKRSKEDGSPVYEGDLPQACREAMRALGAEYPFLKGYYPKAKPIRNSDFMSQQYLTGIYFPFTLEANYNTTMYPLNAPATICHELSHLKGVIMEDEANFFGFLACIRSPDPYLRYSGYLSVLGYVSREVRKTVPKEVRRTMTQPLEQVQKDHIFLTEQAWEKVESRAVVETEVVNQATDVFMETTLKSNGVADGMVSYSRVVRILGKWYEKTKGDSGK